MEEAAVPCFERNRIVQTQSLPDKQSTQIFASSMEMTYYKKENRGIQ